MADDENENTPTIEQAREHARWAVARFGQDPSTYPPGVQQLIRERVAAAAD